MPSLNWIGKEASERACQNTPIYALEARDPKNNPSIMNDNLLIQGDNLFGLRTLLPFYREQIKLAYLDPPYNTGNQLWIYNDAMNAPETKKWLGSTVGPEDLSRSDKWLCMMLPRLEAVYDLLADDGVLVCSIDDAELQNLLALLDAQFGRENRVSVITAVNNPSGRSDEKHVATCAEYLVVYSKNKESLETNLLSLSQENLKRYNKKDSRGRYLEEPILKSGKNSLREDRPNMFYPVYIPNNKGKKITIDKPKDSENYTEVLPLKTGGVEGCWRWGKKRFAQEISAGEVVAKKQSDGGYRIFAKQRLTVNGEIRGALPKSVWSSSEYSTSSGTRLIQEIFSKNAFETSKPLALMRDIVSIFSNPGDLILDPFAGSGTTPHAVLKLNSENPTEEPRRFIAVEMEEEVEKKVTSVRLDKVIKGYKTLKGKAVAGLGGSYSRWTLGDRIRNADGSLGEEASYLSLAQVLAAYHNLPLLESADGKFKDYLIAENDESVLFFFHDQEKRSFSSEDLAAVEKIAQGRRAIVYAHNSFVDEERAALLGVEILVIPYDYPVQPTRE